VPLTLHRHRGALPPAVQLRVREISAAAQAHDGVEALGEQPLLHLADGAPVLHLLAVHGRSDAETRSTSDVPEPPGHTESTRRTAPTQPTQPDPLGALASSPEDLIGYAQLDDRAGTGGAELVVHPDARNLGVGHLLVAGLRSIVLPGNEAGDEPPALAIWAHGNLPAAVALARSAGLAPVRELWRMSRDVTASSPVPAAPDHLPDRVSLRALGAAPGPALPTVGAPPGPALPTVGAPPGPALPTVGAPPGPTDPSAVSTAAADPSSTTQTDVDAAAWLGLNAAAFAHHPEQGRMTWADLHARWDEPWFDADDLLLAEQGGALVGSVWLKVEPGSDEGEIYVLAVAPDAQGRGLGRALTAVALDRMAARGMRRAVLFTEADNHAAVRTYTAAGFTPDRVDAQYG